jgi:hypothetical protein
VTAVLGLFAARRRILRDTRVISTEMNKPEADRLRDVKNGRNGPCPVHLPLQAESNFRPGKKLSALSRPSSARPMEINNTLHAKMAAQLDGAGGAAAVGCWGVDGPLIGHCPSLSRSFFIFSAGAHLEPHTYNICLVDKGISGIYSVYFASIVQN